MLIYYRDQGNELLTLDDFLGDWGWLWDRDGLDHRLGPVLHVGDDGTLGLLVEEGLHFCGLPVLSFDYHSVLIGMSVGI